MISLPAKELSGEAAGPGTAAVLPGPLGLCLWEALQSSPEGRECDD